MVKVQEGMFKLATVEQCFCLDENGLDIGLVFPQNPLGRVPCHCPVSQQAVDLGRGLPDLLRLRVDVHCQGGIEKGILVVILGHEVVRSLGKSDFWCLS